jgi:small conductance mechanosensitive channel
LAILGEFGLYIRDFLPSLVGALFIALVGWFGSHWVKRWIDSAARRAGWDEITWGYASTFARYFLLAVMLIAALRQIGFPVESFLVSIGITGIIIGMGARRSIANYFAGLMMLGAKPFEKGDLIEFGPPPQIGFVTNVNLSYTGLLTLDNASIVVPNSVLWRNKIINHSSFDMRVLQIPIAVPHEVDLDWVKDIALDKLQSHADVLDDPLPRFKMLEITASEEKAQLLGWTASKSVNLYGEIIAELRKEFATAGLSVTVPAIDISLTGEEYQWQKMPTAHQKSP